MSFLLGFLLGSMDDESSGGGYVLECPGNDVTPDQYPDPEE